MLRLREIFQPNLTLWAWLAPVLLSFTILTALNLTAQELQSSHELQSDQVTESSGVCVSRNGTCIWTHNDSGDQPRIFGFHRDGTLAGIVEIEGAKAIDWEDMCSFSVDQKNYLAIGDIGDNDHKRDTVQIYVVEEPNIASLARKGGAKVEILCHLTVKYPNGPVNCEALAYDPEKQVFVLPSKEMLRCRVFELDASILTADRTVEAKLAHTFGMPLVTGADISRDGTQFVLATYGPGCMLNRDAKSSWIAIEPQIFPLPARRQGESICFGAQGKQLLLTSEFAPTPLLSIACPKPD